MRVIWFVAGCLSLALGVIGAFLPIMPTTVFLIIAAGCFARSSDRLHNWLMQHPKFGPALQNWYRHGAVSRKAKVMAISTMAASFLLCVLIGLKPWVLGVQALCLVPVALWLGTRPEGPRQDASPGSSGKA